MSHHMHPINLMYPKTYSRRGMPHQIQNKNPNGNKSAQLVIIIIKKILPQKTNCFSQGRRRVAKGSLWWRENEGLEKSRGC